MSAKKGIASKVGLATMPKTRSGSADSSEKSNAPLARPMPANSRPLAASANATG